MENITYFDSAEGILISKERAIQECEKHSVHYQEMFNEIGEKDEYTASEVLIWLGY